MGDVFEQCGLSYSSDDLSRCRQTYADAADQELEQCATQTAEVILHNLQLKAGSEDPCVALQSYAH